MFLTNVLKFSIFLCNDCMSCNVFEFDFDLFLANLCCFAMRVFLIWCSYCELSGFMWIYDCYVGLLFVVS